MNTTHTSTAAVAAKKSGASNTAKIRKTAIVLKPAPILPSSCSSACAVNLPQSQ